MIAGAGADKAKPTTSTAGPVPEAAIKSENAAIQRVDLTRCESSLPVPNDAGFRKHRLILLIFARPPMPRCRHGLYLPALRPEWGRSPLRSVRRVVKRDTSLASYQQHLKTSARRARKGAKGPLWGPLGPDPPVAHNTLF